MTPEESLDSDSYVYVNADASSTSPPAAKRDAPFKVDETNKDLAAKYSFVQATAEADAAVEEDFNDEVCRVASRCTTYHRTDDM
jgi:hypothetical protein